MSVREDDLQLFKPVPEEFRRIKKRRGMTFNQRELTCLKLALNGQAQSAYDEYPQYFIRVQGKVDRMLRSF